ncbi:tRNA preQ1(34) S-adenosylmethionine ribosyltransferase-isomerase QueA [Candidatus Woesearchaeota archaeon]|nr:MAG: tRNA preQ1(34) S-adenosylmethionine ribosyltransferase-isomerase QueA [Candidatus Woesearchaeota archaeon]
MLEDYDYELPIELIAQKPITKRDESKLLVNDDKISHKKFHNIIDYFNFGDVLVLNETKVKPSVFYGKKDSGAPVRIVIENKIDEFTYICKVKTRTPKVGNKYLFENFKGETISVDNGTFTIRFNKNLDDLIIGQGKLLYPDYVKDHDIDPDRYQTVYGSKEGSLAAPTASLHFTDELLEKIKDKGVKIAKVCLHISYGTFLPIRTDDFSKHDMQEEYFEVSKDSAEIINSAKRLFVSGTTALKCLESCDWNNNKIIPSSGFSKLFIYPGHKFKTPIYGFITNFHLPKSTLLLLVSALVGRGKILNLYKIAIEKDYMFYSFGDAMLFLM